MDLKIQNRNTFINNFLSPLNKINENVIVQRHKNRDNELVSLISSSDGTLILYCTYKLEYSIDDINLSIPDIGKFVKVLNCVQSDSINLVYDTNCLIYKSDDIKFKYHLLEDGILTSPPVNIEKIKSLDFNFSFKITYDVIINLLKGSTFTVDTNKIYFYLENDCLYGQLTDKQKHNIDSYTQLLTKSYKGDLSEPLPLSFEVIRTLSSIRFDSVNVSVNTENNVFVFDISDDSYKLSYIASGYTG